MRLSDLPPEYQEQARASGSSGERKYRNKPLEWQGEKFDSRHELDIYRKRLDARMNGYIRAVIRQVSMPLPHTTRRIRVDFLLVENDGRLRWEDAKGFETPAWRLKRQIVRDAYGIEIELV